MATIPDREEHRRRFAQLDFAQRQQIVRAVNKGRAVEGRKLAVLAVGIARRQKRFWKYAWLVAPVVALLQLFFVPPEVVLLSAGIATLTLGTMSLLFYRRALRAEQANLQLAAGPSAAGRRHPGQATGFGRHLPSRTGDEAPAAGASDTPGSADEEPAIPPDRKPYKPRGRKRR